MSKSFLPAYICWGIAVIMAITSLVIYKTMSVKTIRSEQRRKERCGFGKKVTAGSGDECKFVILQDDVVTHSNVSIWRGIMGLLVMGVVGANLVLPVKGIDDEPNILVNDSVIWVSENNAEIDISGYVYSSDGGPCYVGCFNNPVNDSTVMELCDGDINASFTYSVNNYVVSFGNAEEKKLYVYAVDDDGRYSYKEVLCKLDTKGPEMSITYDNAISVGNRQYSDGQWLNAVIEVDDDGVGADYVDAYDGISYIGRQYVNAGYAYFRINMDTNKKDIVFVATDKLGNESVTMQGSNIMYGDFEAPSIDVDLDEADYESDNILYYTKAPTLYMSCSDNVATDGSGIAKALIMVDSGTVSQCCVSDNVVMNVQMEYLWGEEPLCGAITDIFFYAEDNSKNSNSLIKRICIDNIGPTILNTKFNKESGGTWGEYSIFNGSELCMIVESADNINGSGVAKITVTLEDINGKVYVYEVVPDEEGKCNISVPEMFKGKIYVRAADNVGNIGNTITAGNIILESETHFIDNTIISTVFPDTEYKNGNGNQLYNFLPEIEISAQNSYSGIRQIEWKIYEGDNVIQEGTLTQSGNGIFEDETTRDGSCVRGIIKTCGELGNYRLQISIIGNSGYCVGREYEFGTDMCTPIVNVSVLSGECDDIYRNVFNSDIVVEISISENNFSYENTEILMNGVDMPIDFTEENGVQKAYCTIGIDGEYAFLVNSCDKAGNIAESRELFLIRDTLEPVIEINMIPDVSGGFSQSGVSAYVNIRDENLANERIYVIYDDGTVYCPTINNTAEGNSEFELHFDSDGEYRFCVKAYDKSGNEQTEGIDDFFIIDTKNPEITLSGLEPTADFSEQFAIAVNICDAYIDDKASTLKLGKLSEEESVIRYDYFAGNEIGWNIASFPPEKEYDGRYKITVSAIDLAGNGAEEEYEFTVNRYGSEYSFGEYTQSINGQYLYDVSDISFSEINYSMIVKDKTRIVLSVNGISHNLSYDDCIVYESELSDGRYLYMYRISGEYLESDGVYDVEIYSEDRAGNINMSGNKKFSLRFGVDKTPPVIDVPSLEDDYVADGSSYEVNAYITDNLSISNVDIYVNDKLIEYECVDGKYMFVLDESTKNQDIVIKACDAAGNESTYDILNVLITENPFARWFHNKNHFAGTIVDSAGMAAYIIYKIIINKNKV